MSEARSIHSSCTVRPRMSMPRIAPACASASPASLASLIPPALPRPPIWTWAFTTTGKPISSAACRASRGVRTRFPSGTGIPCFEKSCFPWYSRRSTTAARPDAYHVRPARQAISKANRRRVALPKNVDFVSLEVYGTLIDWETGIYEAFQREAEKDGFTIDRDRLISLFMEIQRDIMSGSYELYAEVQRRTAVRVAEQLGWELEPVRSSFLPNSIPSWPPFRDTNALLERLKKKYQIGLISNIDDKLLGSTRRHFRSDFDLVVTAQQVRSYKPDPAHFRECKRRIGSKTRWIHVATGLETDVIPCIKLKTPVIWIDRHKEGYPQGQRGKPNEIVKDLRTAVKMLGA